MFTVTTPPLPDTSTGEPSQVVKVLKGAVVALLGALAVYGAQVLGALPENSWTPFLVALASVLVNIGRKLLKLP